MERESTCVGRRLCAVAGRLILCISLCACQQPILASSGQNPWPAGDSATPIRVLYIGNLCAGCADNHLEQMALALNPPRIVEVDSVVIPTY